MALGKRRTIGPKLESLPDSLQKAQSSKTLTQNISNTPISDIELTDEFRVALARMENSSECLFITGKAGSGKSTLLDVFRTKTKKKIAVLAPTGVAALNVGGQTIHSFFKFPPGLLTPDRIRSLRQKKLYKSLETLIIDEVSMVRADMMDAIDQFLRVNGNDKNKPFGGIQMIFIGDLFQLPPVISTPAEANYIETNYASPYFFSAHVFKEITLGKIELQKVFRQNDPYFLDVLNAIRNQTMSYEEFELLNSRFSPKFFPNQDQFYITLCSTNKLASKINEWHLNQLKSKSFKFEAEIEGEFNQKILPAEKELILKKGAQVIFVKNDPDKKWVNGTIGKIVELSEDTIKVELESDGKRTVVDVGKVNWEMIEYMVDNETKEILAEPIGIFTQYPLKCAWAITIHKSQGKTFEQVIIDLGYGAFEHGQVYVALSRAKSLEGIVLKRKISEHDLIFDNQIYDFLNEPV